MFERFTSRARAVVIRAHDEARALQHDYIGTEHILLGLIRESDGAAVRALESLDVSLDAVRQRVQEMIGRGEHAQPDHIPFTPGAKKTLELSLREALQLGHNYIGTEHILLGLIREGQGVAAQVLVGLGAELEPARLQVIQVLHGYQGQVAEPAAERPTEPAAERPTEAAAERPPRRSLAALESEIGRLRALLGQHGVDPDSS